ncbi:MAG: PqqD family protein [Spirosomataceae bacterium]|jgi:hypothetical protein
MYRIDNENFIFTKLDGNTIWMNTLTSDFLELNTTSSYLVSLFESGPKSIDDLISSVCKAYEIEPQDCKCDIQEIVEKLHESGLLIQL